MLNFEYPLNFPESSQILAELGQLRRCKKKAILISEGDVDATLFVLLAGEARAFTRSDDGREFVYNHFRAGDIFGEGAIDGGPRTADVEAVTDVVCSAIQIQVLREKIATDPETAMQLIKLLALRNRQTTKAARSLALETAYERVKNLIEEIAEDQKSKTLQMPTQQAMADRIGCSRDMICKIMKTLHEGDYVDQRGRSLVLKKRLPDRW